LSAAQVHPSSPASPIARTAGAPQAEVLVAHTDETIELRVFVDGTCIEAYFLCASGFAWTLAPFQSFFCVYHAYCAVDFMQGW